MQRFFTLVLVLGLFSSILVSCGGTKPCPAYGKVNQTNKTNKSI